MEALGRSANRSEGRPARGVPQLLGATFSPRRNLLDLTDGPKGSGRASFQGSPDEVAADVRRAQKLGAEWMTFDLPRVDVPGMKRAMERLVKEVKPASA